MKAYEIMPGSDLDAIRIVDRPSPSPQAGEVLVEVRACALNFRDVINIRGPQDGSPKVTGIVPLSDAAGIVAEVGAGVSRLRVGDRVAGAFMPHWLSGPMTPEVQASALGGSVDGVLAERVVLPASGVVKIPDHLTYAEASTLPCAGVTAWYAQFVGGHLLPGDSVLLLGTGGVSVFALQFAKMAGARAIITSGSDEKLARAKALGADHTINYRDRPNWHEEVLALTEGRGVDHAVEVGGPDTLNKTLQAVRVGGSISLMGVLTGFSAQLSTVSILHKNIRLQGTYVGSVTMFEAMNRAIALHRMRPVVDRVYAFDEAVAALRHLQSANHFGKVVITLDGR